MISVRRITWSGIATLVTAITALIGAVVVLHASPASAGTHPDANDNSVGVTPVGEAWPLVSDTRIVARFNLAVHRLRP